MIDRLEMLKERLAKAASVIPMIMLIAPIIVIFGLVWVITGKYSPEFIFAKYVDWLSND